MGPLAEQEKEELYRPRPLLLWRVPDAMARMQALLLGAAVAGPKSGGGVSLWRFLPDAEDLASVGGLAREAAPDPALLDRSAVASTLVAGLEPPARVSSRSRRRRTLGTSP